MPFSSRLAGYGLALAGLGLLATTPPALTVLDYYRRLPDYALPGYQATDKPTVLDVANGYLRVLGTPHQALSYAEVAVWKQADGSALIGANYMIPLGGPDCAQPGCERLIHFYAYNPAGGQHWHDVTRQVYFTSPPAVSAVVVRRMREAGYTNFTTFKANGLLARWIPHLPQHGTSIRLVIDTGSYGDFDKDGNRIRLYSVKPALRNKDVTLCYLRWQQDKFVAALEP